MFRKELPDGRGMLFDFEHDGPVVFWMHNTFIPLDMIFIRADGSILRIAKNTAAGIATARHPAMRTGHVAFGRKDTS